MSAVAVLEVNLVIASRKRAEGLKMLSRFLEVSGIRILPFDAEQLRMAADAWWRFGKGRHPAALNLGDCCSYALARATGRPLLYKGADFLQTDLRASAAL